MSPTLPGRAGKEGARASRPPAGSPTWRAGTAQVQGVIQLAHGVLQDALSLGSCALQHHKLLIQEPLLQPLLLRLLVGGEDAA